MQNEKPAKLLITLISFDELIKRVFNSTEKQPNPVPMTINTQILRPIIRVPIFSEIKNKVVKDMVYLLSVAIDLARRDYTISDKIKRNIENDFLIILE